jgi:N-acylneuraminate cytidylyltransferase|tara:strand:+ start:12580 stop:13290 length:711 start_codon:yes stop_codon:yes gene_type:complete
LKAVAFIFARGGSKGLPRKNVQILGDKPLIAWSIDCARKVKRIERIIVSTDCQEIADVALEYGAEVPFMRPAKLATDQSPEWLSWQHALNYLKETEGAFPNVMVSVPATAPLRSVIDLNNCLDVYEQNNDIDVVVTVTDASRSPYFNMVKRNSDGTVDLVISPSKTLTRRQDAPNVYDMATVAYVLRPEFVMTQQSIFDGRVHAVSVPQERAIDIDTSIDFKMAEFYLSQTGDKSL